MSELQEFFQELTSFKLKSIASSSVFIQIKIFLAQKGMGLMKKLNKPTNSINYENDTVLTKV